MSSCKGWGDTPSLSQPGLTFTNNLAQRNKTRKIFWGVEMSGVYLVRCRVTGKRYVGGTKIGFQERFAWQMSALRYGTAPRLLQEHYDRYGPDCFEFVVLKEFPPDEVHVRERQAIQALKPELNILGLHPRVGEGLVPVGDELLSVSQIAARAGVGSETIRMRLRRGVAGEALFAGKHAGPRKPYSRRR